MVPWKLQSLAKCRQSLRVLDFVLEATHSDFSLLLLSSAYSIKRLRKSSETQGTYCRKLPLILKCSLQTEQWPIRKKKLGVIFPWYWTWTIWPYLIFEENGERMKLGCRTGVIILLLLLNFFCFCFFCVFQGNRGKREPSASHARREGRKKKKNKRRSPSRRAWIALRGAHLVSEKRKKIYI